MDQLILVDSSDREKGFDSKENCHLLPTKLHRAFSIFVFSKGKMLITKRSSLKKTWPGFWTNACCSHPRKGEKIEDAVKRRLKEEMGFVCDLKHLFSFEYKADFDKKYGEWELDHVFVGSYDGKINPNKEEVENMKFVDINELKKDVKKNPGKYSPWFKLCFERVIDYAEENKILK